MLNLVFIGCVDFSATLLRCVISLNCVHVAGIVTRNSSKFNSDFCSLTPIAIEHNIPVFIYEDSSKVDLVNWLKEKYPDVIYCFGWSHLLKKEVLNIPRLGVIGYHPTALPRNRGRHPIIWALALGLKETGSSFFMMDEGADSGDLISQRKVKIKFDDNAYSLYLRLETVALEQVEEFTSLLDLTQIQRTSQDENKANYWRKRNKSDGEIDWRMPAIGIYNLVRALTHPYPGAHCHYDGSEYKIWACQIVSDIYPAEEIIHIEPGKVIDFSENIIDVRCGDGVVRLLQHDLPRLSKRRYL